MKESHNWLHHALGFYRNLYHDRSIASMQALTFIIILTRNLPKPGFSWVLSHNVLVRAIDLNYHRSPEEIILPENQKNPLAKELRKRIFWTILAICVTTGTKVGKPAPWHFQHVDCPLPLAIQDDEISDSGLSASRSGKCDFWIALRLFKLLPLLTELYNHAISVRAPPAEYVRIMESLDARIIAWRQNWDKCISVETQDPNLEVQTLHVETWAAEFQIILHHPKLCTSKVADVHEKNMEVCLKSARRLLASFQVLSDRFKGADFTWHSTVAYALGFGATLQSFRNRPEQVTPKAFDAMNNELRGWLRVMSIADLVLRTDNHLYHSFEPRVKKLENEYQNHMVTFEAYNDYQSGSHCNSQQQIQETQQQVKHEYLPQQPQHSSTYMRTPSGPQHQPPPQPMPQQSPYNGYPPQAQPYPPYQTPQYATPQVPQSLAALLNQPSSHQGQPYMPYATTASAPPMMQFAENGYLTDVNGNAMWPNMIMETDIAGRPP
jgi:Fungal specific transcription factor domain